jgi:glucoamylase
MPILVAQKNNQTIVLACSHPWRRSSVGFTGFSDAWMDLAAHHRLTRQYTWAENGRVSLVAEIDLTSEREITLALGVGSSEREAASKAWAGLLEGFDAARDRYLAPWRNWQRALPSVVPAGGILMKNSALVLRWLESKTFPGAILSEGGVRPRDVGSAFDAYMSLEAREDAQRLLAFLMEAEDPGGYWSQILRTDGTPASSSVALDQVARVILMVDACRRTFLLNPSKMGRYWPLVLKAAAYLVSTGPFSGTDRWEEPVTPSLYTLSASVAALLAAADMADERSQPGIATYCRKTADYLFEHIDAWTWFNGYYTSGGRPVPNLPPTPDVLALVRFGLRKPDDPRILDTLKALDSTLRVDTAYGPAWKRTPGEKGLRPLLLIERALYELSAGHRESAAALIKTLSAFGRHGFFPERVEPEGDPFGSPFPHGRTHAEYLRLGCLMGEHRAPEGPRFTAERYLLKTPPVVPFDIWRPHRPGTVLARGKKLRIELPESALIHWSDDDWANKQHTLTRDTYLGVHVAELSPKDSAEALVFTFFWLTEGTWENRNYTIPIR